MARTASSMTFAVTLALVCVALPSYGRATGAVIASPDAIAEQAREICDRLDTKGGSWGIEYRHAPLDKEIESYEAARMRALQSGDFDTVQRMDRKLGWRRQALAEREAEVPLGERTTDTFDNLAEELRFDEQYYRSRGNHRAADACVEDLNLLALNEAVQEESERRREEKMRQIEEERQLSKAERERMRAEWDAERQRERAEREAWAQKNREANDREQAERTRMMRQAAQRASAATAAAADRDRLGTAVRGTAPVGTPTTFSPGATFQNSFQKTFDDKTSNGTFDKTFENSFEKKLGTMQFKGYKFGTVGGTGKSFGRGVSPNRIRR